jgi:hypothetical protein
LSEEKTEYHPICDKAALQLLERSLNEAHQSGTLIFLAGQLASMLHNHYEKYGEITASELEILIAKAAEEIISEAK